MPEDLPADPRVTSYRLGYREGFHDGHAEASSKKDDEAKEDKKADDGDKPKDSKEEPEADKKKDEKKDGDKKPLYKRPLLVLVVLLVLLALIITGIVFWRRSRHHEKTDDAFIDGRASSVAAQTAGRVVALRVEDNQRVRAGDVVVDIDSREADARAAQARAQLANAEAQLDTARAQVEVRRAAAMQAAAGTRQAESDRTRADRDAARFAAVNPDAVPRQQAEAARTTAQTARAKVDEAASAERSARAQIGAAETQVRSAQAAIEAAQAELSAAELQSSYAHVLAPVDGRVTRRQVEVGNVITAGQPLFQIVSDAMWVTANFKETQLTKMRPGQTVDITVDAFPDAKFRGHVDSIQRGTGAYFSMLPAENATGNYVKVVQRVPVKIVFDDNRLSQYAIGPGMSVTPDVAIP